MLKIYMFTFYIMMMILSCISSISVTDWFWTWVFMEANLFLFSPILISMNKMFKKISESSCKYFMLQSLGTSFLIFGILLNEIYNLMLIVATMGLFCKLALYPANFIMMNLSNNVSWISLMLISSFMKIPSLYLLINNLNEKIFLMFFMTSILSSFWGLQTNCLRKIFMSSSFIHLYWMVSLPMNNWFTYMLLYLNLSSLFCLCMTKLHMKNLNNFMMVDYFKSLNLFLQSLSISGFPPMLGFIMKIWSLLMLSNPLLIIILMFLSSLSNYFYLRWMLNFNLMLKPYKSDEKNYNLSNYILLMSMMFLII